MVLSFVLFGITQLLYGFIFLIHYGLVPLTNETKTIILFHCLFLFLLGMATSFMNITLYHRWKKKINMIAFIFAIATVLLILLLLVYGILYRQKWFR